MVELSQTFRHYGLKAIMAPATEKVLKGIAALNLGKPSDRGARDGGLLETLELFFQSGLLQKKSEVEDDRGDFKVEEGD